MIGGIPVFGIAITLFACIVAAAIGIGVGTVVYKWVTKTAQPPPNKEKCNKFAISLKFWINEHNRLIEEAKTLTPSDINYLEQLGIEKESTLKLIGVK